MAQKRKLEIEAIDPNFEFKMTICSIVEFVFRLEMTEEIMEHSVAIMDSLTYAQFRVSKLAQNLSPVPGVVLHKSLVNVNDLSNVIFKNSFEPIKDDIKPANDVDISSTDFVALDVQFMHSQGLRSEIVEISAKILGNCDAFHVICYGQDEQHLSGDKQFKSVNDGLIAFIEYLETKCKARVIITAFNIYQRKWPGLVNHCYFHNLVPRLMSKVRGVCDLKLALKQFKDQLVKCDTIEKVHKQLFNETIEAYKSKEALESVVRIMQMLAQKCGPTWADKSVQDSVATLAETKTKLDASLGDDIAQGRHFPVGHIGHFRMPQNYLDLPESCN